MVMVRHEAVREYSDVVLYGVLTKKDEQVGVVFFSVENVFAVSASVVEMVVCVISESHASPIDF